MSQKDDVVESVVALTGLRNLKELTRLTVEIVTRELHNSNWFMRDVKHFSIPVTYDDHVNGCVTAAVNARRLLAVCVKPYTGKPINVTVYQNFGDYSLATDSRKAALLSGNLVMSVKPGDTEVLVSCVAPVDISDSGYDSWMERDYPGVISYEAASRILGDVGDASHAKMSERARVSYRRMLDDSEVAIQK